MPINTDLNTAPYFDDFEVEKQYYRVLFKPSFAVQSRELIQLQTMLQNQIEQFGDNIFKEGSIVKGSTFTELNDLKYVKLTDKAGFDATQYIGGTQTEIIGAQEKEVEVTYEIVGSQSNLRATIIAAARGFQSRDPDLNTFFINYLNTNEQEDFKVFQPGEVLTINRVRFLDDSKLNPRPEDTNLETIAVTEFSNSTGSSFGLKAAEGVIFQKGHFLYTKEQTVILSKYSEITDDVSVGYRVRERIKNALQDPTLYDNANGSSNENAPGADRLELIPELVAIPSAEAENDTTFFTLVRYENGSPVLIRDVSQFNILGEELAKRTYEESGNYITEDFKSKIVRKNGQIKASVGAGVAYVNGYRVENGGERFIDIDQVTETATRQNQPVSFDYGNFVDVVNIEGTVSLGDYDKVTLRNVTTETSPNGNTVITSSEDIGTARVKNITPDRLYIFDIKIEDSNYTFADANIVSGPSGEIEIDSSVVRSIGHRSLVFDTGMENLYDATDISIPVRDQTSISISSNTIELTSNPGEDFLAQNDDIVIVDENDVSLEVSSVFTSSNSSILTIELEPGQLPGSTATLYYNKRIVDAEPYGKIVKTPYLKINYSSTDQDKRYNLGFPDVFEIISVEDSNGKDVTNSFVLRTNQKDNFYDISHMEYVPGTVEPANGILIVQMKVFKLDTASGIYFFTAASYPVSNSTFDSTDIPTFESSIGNVFNLKNCFDFRPHAQKVSNADYDQNVPSGAPLISAGINDDPTFTGGFLTPAVNQSATVDLEYYLKRIDAVILDSYGKFSVVKGQESEKSTPPRVKQQLKVAEIEIPGKDALTPQEAGEKQRPDYAIRVTPKGVKNYTMEEVGDIEKRIESLEYYVSLNSLEQKAKDVNVVDENGLTRFKNGIVVDPFEDLSYADIENINYSAAIDNSETALTPEVKGFPISLKYKNSTNVSIFPSTSKAQSATLSRNQNKTVVSQKYASNFRNCVSNFYNYAGDGVLFPAFDFSQDFVTNPTEANVGVNGVTFQAARNIQGINPLVQTTTRRTGNRRITTRTANLGDFITDLRLSPFIRSRDVNVYMTGLRPNTQHYFFFDEEDVNSNVIPGTDADNAEDIERNGDFGDPVVSDDNGIIRAIFVIPEETFFAGDRVLRVADVDQYDSIESAGTSGGEITYRAFNFEGERTSLNVQTTTTRNVSRRRDRRRNRRRVFGRGDPLAQTFFVKEGMGQGSDTVFVSKVDLYFRRKSQTNGMTVMIREVENGYPSTDVVEFGKVHLTPDEVSVSENASAATEVRFNSPVKLDTEKEYAVVVKPDANDPDYLIYTSKVGGADITPGETQGLAIVQDWGDGVLFTSTNNRAWRSYQDEDIKFTLHRHDFNETSGTVTLTNDDNEFFKIGGVEGKFRNDEKVYSTKSVAEATDLLVRATSGNDIITGTGLDATYGVGDNIHLSGSGISYLFRVVEIINSGEIRVAPAPTFTNFVIGRPAVIGKVSYYNYKNEIDLHLEKSTANSSRKFEVNDEINGIDSGASASITSIENIDLSYIQPMISKTVDTASRISGTGTFTYPDAPDSSYTINIPFNDNIYFNRYGTKVYSKSNDTNASKPFDINLNLANGGNSTSSPLINIETAAFFAYQYAATNTAETTAKYISKTIELAADLDAEDFRVYLSAYRPKNTEVKVYIKPQHASDSTSFEENNWIELEIVDGELFFSSSTNRDDFREYVYDLPASAKNGDGALTYTNINGETFEGYRKFSVKIELLSEDIYNVPRILNYRGIALT